MTSLPFSWDITMRPLPMLCEDFDYPVRQVGIDGEVWMIFVPGRKAYGGVCPVLRYRGADLEHLERLPDGVADLSGASGHLGCGMWWDESSRTLYSLIHSEYAHNSQQGWCSKKTRLATSIDLGLTWTLVGDILTRALPNVEDYAGAFFEAGPADFDFYADVRGGYFYVTSWNSFTPKAGKLNGFMMYSEVARCAIVDTMAPGSWFKFREGTWSEPGLGGKASRLGFDQRGLYGSTIYSSYLRRYLRIGIHVGATDDRGMPGMGFTDHSLCISTCTDLAKQDWAPMATLIDEPANRLFGFSLSDAQGIDPVECGKTFRAYNYWMDGNRALDITLHKGNTPSRYFPPNDSYDYEPHPDSGDAIESRKTRIVGAADPDIRYEGAGWNVEEHDDYYQRRANVSSTAGDSIQFTFLGDGIYWRAVASGDAGKADVFIDDVWQQTVDCYFAECALPYQFAFIHTGLDATRQHTIKIVVRGDKHPYAIGALVRHIAFEYAEK